MLWFTFLLFTSLLQSEQHQSSHFMAIFECEPQNLQICHMTSSLSQSEFFFPSDLIPTQRTCETSHKNISHLKSIAVEQLC